MKNLLFSIILIAGTSLAMSAQSFEYYLKTEGVANLAEMAHPTNSYIGGTYEVRGSDVIVVMNYKENITTKVRLSIYKGWVTDVTVLFDNDWFPPFLGVEIIKDVVYEIAKEESQSSNKMISNFERYLAKEFQQFNGKEVASLAMSLDYLLN